MNSLKVSTINAAHIEATQNYILTKQHVTVDNSGLIKQKRHIEQKSQASSSKTQTFLELLLGIIDTLQFGKRKIGAPS